MMDWLVPHYTRPPTQPVILHFNTRDKMCPRGGQLYLMHYVGPKGFWARGNKKYCIIFPQHTSLQPSMLHPQEQWSHCTEEVRILSFLLLQGQHFLLILQQGFAVGWGRLLPTQMTLASWKLRPELHCLFLEPTAQFSLLPFSILSTAQVLLLNSHHQLLQKKILNTEEVNKMQISICSYSEDGITRQLFRMSKWS